MQRQYAPEGIEIPLKIELQTIRALARIIIDELGPIPAWPAGRISLTEQEAADAIGVGRHVLRDLRLAGKLQFSEVGRQIVYTQQHLHAALEVNTGGQCNG